jgi:hypothetical protein
MMIRRAAARGDIRRGSSAAAFILHRPHLHNGIRWHL